MADAVLSAIEQANRWKSTPLPKWKVKMDSTHSEGSTIGKSNRKIGKYGKQSVCHRRPKSKIMRYLMDGKEKVLICSRTDYICGDEKLPRQHRSIPEKICAGNLQKNHG
jgi:hypothetical protein